MRRAIGLVVLALCLLLPAAGWSQINYYPATGEGGSFDPDNVIVFDDFVSGGVATGTIGAMGWNFLNGSVTSSVSVDNAPGVWTHRNTAASGVSSTYLTASSGTVSILGDLRTISFRMAFGTGANVPDKRIGVLSTAVNAAPSDDAVYFECLAADTNWFAVTRDGAASQTRTDTGVAFAASTFAVFRVEHTATSTWAFYVNDALKATHTAANTPPAEATQIYPFTQLVTTGTANIDWYHDYFVMRLTPDR